MTHVQTSSRGFLGVDRCHDLLQKLGDRAGAGRFRIGSHEAKGGQRQPDDQCHRNDRGNHNPGPIAIDEFLRPIEATGWPGLDRVMI